MVAGAGARRAARLNAAIGARIVRAVFANLASDLRAMPRPLWMLFAGTFVNKFGSFVMPFLVLHLTKHGHSPAKAGLAVGAYGVGHLAASALGGWLADRIGRRTTIALSMFTGAAAMLALSQAETFSTITALTLLLGAASELYRPACSALVTDLAPPEKRVTAFAVYRLAINAGFACGPATAGFLAEKLFIWLFIGDAITSALFGVIALATLPDGERQRGDKADWRADLKQVARDREFLCFLLAVAPITFVFFQMTASLPLHVRDVGLSSAAYGVLISLNGLIVVICELPLTSVTQRLPARPVMALGYLLTGLGYALTAFARDAWTLAGTVLVWTLGEMLASPVSLAYVAGLAPLHMRGRYLGMVSVVWALGLIAGPTWGTALYAHDAPQLWALCAGLGVASALCVWVGPERRQVEQVP